MNEKIFKKKFQLEKVTRELMDIGLIEIIGRI